MKKTKELFIISFALFSLFFGAGNLILPPLLGFNTGELWWLVAFGFCLSAVFIPILGVQAYSRLQGTMFDFGKKVSPLFSILFCFIIYTIAIVLPSPRTASVTHEIGIAPLFDSPPLLTSVIYFVLVFLFVMNRSKILEIIGKWLTPGILIILVFIIGRAFFSESTISLDSTLANPFTEGVLEGYQTFDAIGAIVAGGVIIVSVNLGFPKANFEQKKDVISKAGWIAGLGLLLVYTGLIFSGAIFRSQFETSISRTNLLKGISEITLGAQGDLLLSILVSLACFTTCVGIVAGTADYFQSRLPKRKMTYLLTAFISCLIGIIIGQLDVAKIIEVAIPVLIIIYPLTIVLILLNVLPLKVTSEIVFKVVVFTTVVFSIPDLLISLGYQDSLISLTAWIPFANYKIGWLVPAIISFVVANGIHFSKIDKS